MSMNDTIVTLSSGSLPSGVAVIRLSGSRSSEIVSTLCRFVPKPRHAQLVSIIDPENKSSIDQGLVIWFPGPSSFTAEDLVEFQVHGGSAVVEKLLSVICSFRDTRLAEAGEFSRRAFENGKLDLTEIEGLADLISAQTEEQRRQALDQSSGRLREQYEAWRAKLLSVQAMYVAEIDFVDEDDVPEGVSKDALVAIAQLRSEIEAYLEDNRSGEIIRDGFRVALMGAPNSGKSTLLNVLAKRDVAIVSAEAGTTRDSLDVFLNIAGFEVVVTDTAGIRATSNVIESEGVRRAVQKGESADLIVWLYTGEEPDIYEIDTDAAVLALRSKDDLGELSPGCSISAETGYGVEGLLDIIGGRLDALKNRSEPSLISRRRHRDCLERCVSCLAEISEFESVHSELASESLRRAADALANLSGRIDVEDLLDVVFAEFCIGK